MNLKNGFPPIFGTTPTAELSLMTKLENEKLKNRNLEKKIQNLEKQLKEKSKQILNDSDALTDVKSPIGAVRLTDVFFLEIKKNFLGSKFGLKITKSNNVANK